MKPITAALLLMLLGQTPALCPTQHTGSLQGQVYATYFGILLSDIELKLMRDGRVIKTARTDTEGNYRINEIPPGVYRLVIEETGFVRKQLNVDLVEGEQKLIDIAVEAGHWENYSTPQEFNISGKVSETNGKGIARASVVVVSPFNGNQVVEVITDEKGQYKLPAKEGQFLIYASRPGYIVRCESVLLRVVSTKEQRTINFILEPFGSK